MSAQPEAVVAIAKPKRKYTKRKPKLAVVKPTTRKELPKTARAYLRTLGIGAETEGTAIKELIKLHNGMNKSSQKPAIANVDLLTRAPVKEEPKSLWGRFIGWLAR